MPARALRHKGNALGEKYLIDKIISSIEEKPNHTQTRLSVVEGWKNTGYTFAHVSWIVNKCRICNETSHTEYYTAPINEDGSGPFLQNDAIATYYQLTNKIENRFKNTTKIPTSNNSTVKREVAVEPMKKYS